MCQRKALRKLRALQWIQSIQVMRLQPGDVVVLKADTQLSQESQLRIYDHLKRLFPKNQSVILDAGLKLSKVSQGQNNEPE